MNNSETLALGIVVDFNPVTYSADVLMDDGNLLVGLPILGLAGSDFTDDLTWLSNLAGCRVWVLQAAKKRCILGTYPDRVKSTASAVSTSQGDADVVEQTSDMHQANGFCNFNSNRPTDLLPGDKALRADGGAEVALSQGGLAWLKASSLAQFILSKYKSLARLIVRRFQIFSDFGEVELFHSEDGRVGLSVKGGAVYDDETHPDVADWTVQLFLGDASVSGEGSEETRLFVKTNAPGGGSDITISFDTEGTISINAAKDLNITTSGTVNLESSDEVNITSSTINLN